MRKPFIGMKVIGQNFTNNYEVWNNCLGKVIAIEDNNTTFLVKFSKSCIMGHTGNGRCSNTSCLWFSQVYGSNENWNINIKTILITEMLKKLGIK